MERLRKIAIPVLVLIAVSAIGAQRGSASTITSTTAAVAIQAEGTSAAEVQMLPQPMRPYVHVFAAFGITWLLILGYALTVGKRMDEVQSEVERHHS